MSALSSSPSATVPVQASSAAAPRNTGRRRGPRRRPWATTLLIAGVLATIAVFAVPLYWLFSSALKPRQDIYSWPLQWLPRELTFDNFVAAWNAAPFDRFFLNSIITTGVGTVLELTLAILCAYAFVFVDFRFKKIAFVLIIGSMMLPGHVTLIVNYMTVANLGWLNSYAGIILPGIASAFAMFPLFQYARSTRHPAGRRDRRGRAHPPHAHDRGAAVQSDDPHRDPDRDAREVEQYVAADRHLHHGHAHPPIGLLFLRSQEGYNWGAIMAAPCSSPADAYPLLPRPEAHHRRPRRRRHEVRPDGPVTPRPRPSRTTSSRTTAPAPGPDPKEHPCPAVP